MALQANGRIRATRYSFLASISLAWKKSELLRPAETVPPPVSPPAGERGIMFSRREQRHEFAAPRRPRLSIPVKAEAAGTKGELPKPTSPPSPGGRIPWSDVEVRGRRKGLWEKPWSALEAGTAAVVLSMHALCLFAPFTFSWGALSTAAVLYVLTGLLGITLSYHRNLAHRSFRLPKWLEYTFAYFGVQALQGNPLDWVSTHRLHHQHCDSDGDPHSPLQGFWFSHMTWLFDATSIAQRSGKQDNVADLEKQPFYRFLRQTYILHPAALALLLFELGGFPFLVWGMGVRIVWVYHITWLVNSACHVWGRQAWNTGDLSRNNWWVALLAFGEGWHNNHHAFEYSARHGLEWWQVDMTWYVVRLLQAMSLATEVRLPTRAHVEKMRLPG